jgi:hypothetical protein
MDITKVELAKVRVRFAQKALIAQMQQHTQRHVDSVRLLQRKEEALAARVQLDMRAHRQLLGQSRVVGLNTQQLVRPNVMIVHSVSNVWTSRPRLLVLLAFTPSTWLLVRWQATVLLFLRSPPGKMKASIIARNAQQVASANVAIWRQCPVHRGTMRCLGQQRVQLAQSAICARRQHRLLHSVSWACIRMKRVRASASSAQMDTSAQIRRASQLPAQSVK